MNHQQLVATIFVVALASLGGATIALFLRQRDSLRGFWLMVGLWGLLDGVIVWPSLIREPMGPDELRGVLGVNLLLQLVYLPTGIYLTTRTQPLVKGFGWGVLASAVPLALIDAVFYMRLLS
jgi:hypothetical protein